MAGISGTHPHHTTAAEREQHQAQSVAACEAERDRAEAKRTGSADQHFVDGAAHAVKSVPILGSIVAGVAQHYKDVVHPKATATNVDGLRACVGLAADAATFIPLGRAVSAAEKAVPAGSKLLLPIGEKLLSRATGFVEQAGGKAIAALEHHGAAMTGSAERAVGKALEHAPKALEKAVDFAEKQVDKRINPMTYAKIALRSLDKPADHEALKPHTN